MTEKGFGTVRFFALLRDARAFAKGKKKDGYKVEIGRDKSKKEYAVIYW